MTESGENISAVYRSGRDDPVVFGAVTYGAGGTWGPRVQSDYQLVLLHEGHADISLDDESEALRVPAGSVALLQPGRREYFRFARKAPTRHSWCALRPAAMDPLLAGEIAKAAPVTPISPGLEALVRLGLSIGRPHTAAANRLLGQLGLTALCEFLAISEGLCPIFPAAVQRACHVIETGYAEARDLAGLARAACVTPAHLIRLFHAHLGTTPVRYLWRVRLEAAVRLLRETGLTIGEVAERTGFSNPFHLSRMVRQRHGVSPRLLREQAWKQGSPGRPK